MTRGYVEQSVDLVSEEAAIIAVNEKQMAAYVARDYAGEAEVWAQEPYIVHYYSTAPDIGWETISCPATILRNHSWIDNRGLSAEQSAPNRKG